MSMDEVNGMLLQEKTAVVTGCNRGIGKAILERMAANGADVFAVVRRETAEFAEYGATVLTRIPNTPSSMARRRTAPTIAALLAVYSVSEPPSYTAVEEIKVILPFLFFIIFLLMSCVKSSGEKKLIWNVFFISSMVVIANILNG